MQKLVYITLLVVSLSACATHEKNYTIKGTLPSAKYDGTWIYLYPFEAAQTQKTDSFKIEKASFSFTGIHEHMAVIRTKPPICFFLQELLVVTEPGVTTVTIDSVSSSKGTPQNDALQEWKENREKYSKSLAFINRGLRSTKGKDSLLYVSALDTLNAQTQRYNYNLLKGNKHNTLGTFISKLVAPSLTPEQRKKLDETKK